MIWTRCLNVMDNPATSGQGSAIIPAIIKMVPIVTANEAISLISSDNGDAGIRICSCKIIFPQAALLHCSFLWQVLTENVVGINLMFRLKWTNWNS